MIPFHPLKTNVTENRGYTLNTENEPSLCNILPVRRELRSTTTWLLLA